MNIRLIFAGLVVFPIMASAQTNDRPPPPEDKGWAFYMGAGALYAPTWLGDDDYNLSAVPFVRVTYDDKFFASVQEGAGYAIINSDDFRTGPLATIDFGRDEDGSSPFRVAGDKTTDLVGLGKIDFSIAVGGFADFEFAEDWKIKTKAGKAFGGHDGVTGQIGLDYSPRIMGVGPPLFLNIGPNVKLGDSNYMQSYFGITPEQAISSGLDEYSAGSGVTSYGLSGSILMPLSYTAGITVFGSYDKLTGDAADSPLVRERGSTDQFFTGAAVAYKF